MPSITPHTVAELIYWSYANLAMAQDGINRGLPTYDKTSFIIRIRLFKGLLSGKLQISSLFKDERWKMENGARCVYCGATENLSVDHLFPRIKGGADNVENLVCSCKSCNSSKGKKDLMVWYNERGQFHPSFQPVGNTDKLSQMLRYISSITSQDRHGRRHLRHQRGRVYRPGQES